MLLYRLTINLLRRLLCLHMDKYEEAADLILGADFILIAAGAGFSADSGLPVYSDVARHSYYAAIGKDYADLADTNLLMEDPDLFWKFWGDCNETYRASTPHRGYEILEAWLSDLPKMADGKCTNPWYVYTSNVDGHFRRFGHLRQRLCEIHGCTEESVCSSSLCYYVSRKHSAGINADLDKSDEYTTTLHQRVMNDRLRGWNQRGTAQQRSACQTMVCQTPRHHDMSPSTFYADSALLQSSRVPMCLNCLTYPLRPLVVMFGDVCPNVIPRIWQHTDKYQQWEDAMEADVVKKASQKRIVVLELGCGTRVPSVRREVEDVVYDVCTVAAGWDPLEGLAAPVGSEHGVAALIRINLEESAISEGLVTVSPDSLSIADSCLTALQRIDACLRDKLSSDRK